VPTYFDSNNPNPGNGLTPAAAKTSMSGFAITNTDANTRDIRVASGSVFNLTASITSAAATTAGKITFTKYVSGYGSSANPVIYSSLTGSSHDGWYRCDPNEFKTGTTGTNIVTTTPAALASRVWYKKGMGTAWLFGDAGTRNANGTHWGMLRKIITAPTSGSWPSADYHIAEIYVTRINGVTVKDANGNPTYEIGTLFWSSNTEDPLDYYGITIAQTSGSLISLFRPVAGVEYSGIDFGPSTQYSIDISYGTVDGLSSAVVIRDFRMDRSLGMRIGSGVTSRANTVGVTGLLIEDIVAKNLGNVFLGTWASGFNSAHVFNNAIIRHNVVAGVCERFSLGGIYLLNCRTNDGSKIQVYENTVSGAKRDNVWPDGYAIYTDFSADDYDIYRNYVWDSDLSFRNNGTTGVGIIRENVAIAKVGASASSSAFGSNDPNDVDTAANITLSYNVSVGFNKFAGYQDLVPGSSFNIHHNVSVAKAGASYAVDSRDSNYLTLDSNNFYGYATHWADTYAPTGDLSYLATNKITGDPTTALTNGGVVLNPTDKEFNYALSLPNMVWSGTPTYGGVAPRVASGANTVAAVTSAGTSIAISNATSSKTTDAVTSTGTGTVSVSATGATTINAITSTGTSTLSANLSGANLVDDMVGSGDVFLVPFDSFVGANLVDDVVSVGSSESLASATGANTVAVFSDSATSLIVVSVVATGENTTSVSSAGTAVCETLCSGASVVADVSSTGEVDVTSSFIGENTVDSVSSIGDVAAYTSALSNMVLDDVFSSGEVGTFLSVVGANTVDDITAYEPYIDELLRWKHSTTRRHTPWVTQ
jgi:hypothetical protein